MTRYEDPIPTNASKANVAAFAESVAKSLGYEAGQPVEIAVSKLNGAISYKNPVGEKKPESIRVEPSGSLTIYLPSMTSSRRDRFTIAHELGHYFLHFPMVTKEFPGAGMRAYRWIEGADAKSRRCEWEANWFAASFVMPEQKFREIFQIGGTELVSSFFGVSENAAEVRARSLNIA